MDRKLNTIKAALADKDKTNKWLAEQLDKDPACGSERPGASGGSERLTIRRLEYDQRYN